MTTFTIDADNNITAYTTAEEATQGGEGLTQFESQTELAKISTEWPLSRFVEVWNSIPGNGKVSKFQDRKKAIARVWKAIQPLAANSQADEPEPSPACGQEVKAGKYTSQVGQAGQIASGREKGNRRHQEGEPDQDRGSTRLRPSQQEGRGDRVDEARQGRNAGRGDAVHGLAEAHRKRIRQHLGQ